MRRPAAACRHGPYGEGVAEPRMPYGARPLQVLLAVGAVLVVTAAVGVVSGPGGAAARVPLLALAVVTAGLSVGTAWSGLRSTEETLGACSLGFALAAVGWRGAAPAVLLLLLAGVLAALVGLARTTAVWPLGAWLTLQLAVLRSLGPACWWSTPAASSSRRRSSPPRWRSCAEPVGDDHELREVTRERSAVCRFPSFMIAARGAPPGSEEDLGADGVQRAGLRAHPVGERSQEAGAQRRRD